MPSPIIKNKKGRFYRRSDGAWVKLKGSMKKVGNDVYKPFGFSLFQFFTIIYVFF
ncbi:MAG: hypothetical protein ACOCUD_01645 [Bacillota bacterium]